MAVDSPAVPTFAPTIATSSRTKLAARVADWLTARRVFKWGAISVALLAVPGLLTAAEVFKGWLFDYNLEHNVPSGLSAAMLVMATVAALLWAELAAPTRRARHVGWLLAVLFLYMSGDEFLQFHEKLEHHIGIDWEVLYLPIMLGAAFGSFMLLTKYVNDRNARLVYLLGSAGWGIAAILEKFEYNAHDKEVNGFKLMMVLEENGELVGSMLLGIALLLALEAVRRRHVAEASVQPGPEPEPISYTPIDPISYRAD